MSSDLVFLLDSDDIWHPEYVARMIEVMQADPAIHFAFSEYHAWASGRDERPEMAVEGASRVEAVDLVGYVERMDRGSVVLPSFQVFRLDALRRLGDRPYPDHRTQGEALYVNGLLAAMGKVVRVREHLGLYRLHVNAVTADEMHAARHIIPCLNDLLEAGQGGLGLGLEIDAESMMLLRRHARNWYRSCGRRLGGGGDVAAGRAALLSAARLGDPKSAIFLAASVVPLVSSKVWRSVWRENGVHRVEAGDPS